MANFLIYTKVHWYDLPTRTDPLKTGYQRQQQEIDDSPVSDEVKTMAQAILTEIYNSRAVLHDIVEVRRNELEMCGKEPLSYALIKVPELTIEQAKQYTGSLTGEDDKLIYKFKNQIDISGISLDKDRIATINLTEFNNRLTVKK